MTRYLALIDQDENGFGAIFPDAPGCVAMGATQEEAIKNAADALSEWIGDLLGDGDDIPPPRTARELLRDKEVARDLAQGAILASVPVLLNVGRPARANISIDAGLLADIDEASRRLGVTRSAFLSAAARDKIKSEV
jgi:predicted RNase H-like HicB family nuclease